MTLLVSPQAAGRVSPQAAGCWRPARAADLSAIHRLAALIHPAYPERPQVFADRLASHPSGVLLAAPGDTAVGYAIGHPWCGAAPRLDHCLGILPADPDCYWIHDLALLPSTRGRGIGRAALALLLDDAARHRLRRLRLVAVGRAGAFWRAAGFTPTGESLPACYGIGAAAMQLSTGQPPDALLPQ